VPQATYILASDLLSGRTIAACVPALTDMFSIRLIQDLTFDPRYLDTHIARIVVSRHFVVTTTLIALSIARMDTTCCGLDISIRPYDHRRKFLIALLSLYGRLA
jgi:hypothetical protein